jgi:hypothetical protein
MYMLAIRDEKNELHYWDGGETWSSYSSEAVRFAHEADVDATIDLLKKTLHIPPTAHVVRIPAGREIAQDS